MMGGAFLIAQDGGQFLLCGADSFDNGRCFAICSVLVWNFAFSQIPFRLKMVTDVRAANKVI